MSMSFLTCFVILGFCLQCQPDKTEYQRNGNTLNDQTLNYLALGDSYTIGESVEDSLRWPEQLIHVLNQDGLRFAEPKIIAVTGWTTHDLLDGMTVLTEKHQFDLVSLLIGVNNQYRQWSIDIYKSEFEILIKRAVQLAGDRPGRVFIVSIPDWGVTPFAQNRDRQKISMEIDAYNAIQEKIAEKYGVPFFNITDISRLAVDDLSLIANDGLHPSGRMYWHWVQRFRQEVFDMMKSR